MTGFLLIFFSSTVFGATINNDWRIVGGQTAADGAFPYQAYIRVYGEYNCGGSIIDATTILTAALCLFPYGDEVSMSVTVGSNALDQGGDSYEIAERRIHEFYDPMKSYKNDIGILKLKTPILFNEKVKPVNGLPVGEIGAEIDCVFSGWGLMKFPGHVANELQYLDLVTFPVDKCSEMWDAFGVSLGIDDRQLCTLTKSGQGACYGDLGGPLVDRSGLQIGISTLGFSCDEHVPDVFTKVSYFSDWIERNRR